MTREELLSSLFDRAQKAIEVGAEAIGLHKSKIVGNILYMKNVDLPGYLAISPIDHRIFNTDDDLKPIEENSLITLLELEVLNGVLEFCLGTISNITVTDAKPISEENEGWIITLYRFADIAIQTGAEKMGFKSAKVQDDTLYIKCGEGYLAIKPSGKNHTEKFFRTDGNLEPSNELFSIGLDEVKEIVCSLEERLIHAGVYLPPPNEI